MTTPLEQMMQGYSARIVEGLKDAKVRADRTDNPFERGCQAGFYLALTSLVRRANSAGVDLRSIGLDGIDPDDIA